MKRQLYYPQLDAIRGLSFLGIFLFHSIHPVFTNGMMSSFLEYIYNQLPLAIDVFFLLSSFLLTRIGLAEYEKRQNFSFINYFTRRALRIWPLYYLLMFFSFVIIPVIAQKSGITMVLPDPLFYVFFVSNYYHADHVFFLRILWTLSVEEQFYLLLGLALRFFVRYLAGIFLFFILLSIIFSIYSSVNEVYSYFHTLTYFFDFAAGGIAAILFSIRSKYIAGFSDLTGWKKVFFYGYLPFHFIIFYVLEMAGEGNWDNLVNRYFFIVYITLLIIEQLTNQKRLLAFEKSRFLIYTGKISYGLYCFHGISIIGMDLAIKHFHIQISQYLVALIVFCMNFIIAAFSYTFFEKPFLKLKEKVRRV